MYYNVTFGFEMVWYFELRTRVKKFVLVQTFQKFSGPHWHTMAIRGEKSNCGAKH
jgi:hypothetical protein